MRYLITAHAEDEIDEATLVDCLTELGLLDVDIQVDEVIFQETVTLRDEEDNVVDFPKPNNTPETSSGETEEPDTP